jgi:hypothetical protein
MGWLLLVALAVMWVAFLLPSFRRTSRGTIPRTVEDFERDMDLLAETDGGTDGRWIVAPRKGTTFIGSRARAQARARERRRRVLVVLIESVVLTGSIGLVPPLRAMWYATGLLLVALGAYVWLLLSMKAQRARPATPRREVMAPARAMPARQRYAADAAARTARPAYNGLTTLREDAPQIVVRRASALSPARV